MDLPRAAWRKSTYSTGNGNNCVEAARALPGVIALRDSKNPDGPMLTFSRVEWQAFIGAIKSGGHVPR